MARYIDADALIEALKVDYDREGARADKMAINGLADASVKYSHGQFCYLNAIEQVKDTPTADVVPKKEGKWEKRIFIIFDSEKVGYRCSVCHTTWDTETNFCPYCGAKMKGYAE